MRATRVLVQWRVEEGVMCPSVSVNVRDAERIGPALVGGPQGWEVDAGEALGHLHMT